MQACGQHDQGHGLSYRLLGRWWRGIQLGPLSAVGCSAGIYPALYLVSISLHAIIVPERDALEQYTLNPLLKAGLDTIKLAQRFD